MYMALISTDEVCIWLYGNLQYSVTENFITRIPQYIIIFTCGNLSQIITENETVFAVLRNASGTIIIIIIYTIAMYLATS